MTAITAAALAVAAPVAPGTQPSTDLVAVSSGPDFDADGYADLALSAPGQCEGCGFVGTGALHVLYGSATGPSTARRQMFWPGAEGMVGHGTTAVEFGHRLAWGDLDGDGFDDLAVAAPEDVMSGEIDAGSVRVLYGSAAGLTVERNQLWSLAGPQLAGHASGGDRFGEDLAIGDFDGDGYRDLAIVVGDQGTKGVGPSTRIVYGSATGLTPERAERRRVAHQQDVQTQHLAAGDFDADGIDDLVVGQSGARHARGSVKVYLGESGGLSGRPAQTWSQQSPGIDGDERPREYFGSSVAAGDVNGDGYDELIVGIRSDRVEGEKDSGALQVLRGSADGVVAADNQLVEMEPLRGELRRLGPVWSVRAADTNGDGYVDVAVNHQSANVYDSGGEEGAVAVLPGSAAGLVTSSVVTWTQNSPDTYDGSEPGDGFGRGIGWGDYDGDGFADLAIGAAYEDKDVTFEHDTGLVLTLKASAAGLRAWTGAAWEPDDFGMVRSWTPGLRLGFDIA